MTLAAPLAAVSLALKRMWSRRLMTVLLLVGLTVAAAIPAALPMYSNAATARLLVEQEFASFNYRPPFAHLYWYAASLSEPVGWDDVAEADTLLSQRLVDQQLPASFSTSFVDTIVFDLRDPARPLDADGFGNRAFGALGDFEQRAELVDGRFPQVRSDGVIEVAIAESLTAADDADDATALRLGDRFEALDPRATPEDPAEPAEAVVVGVWRPADPDDPRWIMLPEHLETRLIAPRAVITEQLSALRPDVIRNAAWYAILDPSRLTTDDVAPFLNEAQATTATAERLLPGVDVVQSPVAGFEEFRQQTEVLVRRLIAYSVPALGLLLLFTLVLVALVTDERRNELAVLHSRGVPRRRLLAQITVEALIVSTLALVLAIPLARWLARTIGRSSTFLDLGSDAAPLTVVMSRPVWVLLGAILIGAVVLQVLPAWRAAGATTASHDEWATRATRRPWWQRTGLDLAVIAIAGLTVYQFAGRQPDTTRSIVADPLLVVLPALAALAVGLVILRITPLLLDGAARLASLSNSTVALIAARRAARSPGTTNIPLLLLVVTVSSAIFTASLARTLDVQLYDEEFHRLGADWVAQELNSHLRPNVQGAPLPRNLAPLDEYMAIDGVAAVSRVGRYSARVAASEDGPATAVSFVGVDPDKFAEIAFFRDDFTSRETIPDLMGVLSEVPEAIIVSPDLGASVGDELVLTTSMDGDTVETRGVVAGVVDGFPAWSPDGEPLVVGRLDQQFLHVTDPGGYRVWMRLEPGLSSDQLGEIGRQLDELRPMFLNESPIVSVATVQAEPTRQGAFGVLTAGFIASLLVSMLGFFFASVYEVRRATAELGTLQALGLAPRKVAGVVVLELGAVMAVGTVGGVVTGSLLASRLIDRMLGDSGLSTTPQLIIELDQTIRWTVIGLIALLFGAIALVLVYVLRRMRIFQALKLGETR